MRPPAAVRGEALTTTMLSWRIMECRGWMECNVHDACTAVRLAADYLLNAAMRTPGKLYVGVGDPNADHRCWEQPEDMDMPVDPYYASYSGYKGKDSKIQCTYLYNFLCFHDLLLSTRMVNIKKRRHLCQKVIQ